MSDSVIHINVCCHSKHTEKINAFIDNNAKKRRHCWIKRVKDFYTNLIPYLCSIYLVNSVNELPIAVFPQT